MQSADDIDREAAGLLRATKTPRLVDVPELTFLMVDGRGDPNTAPAYRHALETLYPLSYALKSAVTKAGGPTHKVGPLEGLWWARDMGAFFEVVDRAAWEWTMMIRQPGTVMADLVERVSAEVGAKKHLPALDLVRFGALTEGRAAQVLHVGPYPAEGPTIARLHAFVAEQGLHLAGKHHEIYLGDPRRAAPEKLRTIIRQPVTA